MANREQHGIRHESWAYIFAGRYVAGFALALALTLPAGMILHAQSTPPAPEALPVPPEPPEPPELAEPPGPPDSPEGPQIFVFNDRSVQLGVALDDVTAQKAQELKLPDVAGALVTEAQEGSAADKAGVKAGDVIAEFDGIRVRSAAELRRLVRETPSGRTVEIKVVRDGKSHTLSAKLEASEKNFNYNYRFNVKTPGPMFYAHIPPPMLGPHATLGIEGDDLTPQLAKYFGVNQGTGVLVFEVTLGGAADKAGLKAGDVITQVDGKPVRGVEELRRALNENFSGDTRKVSLTIVRDHHEHTLTAELTRSRMMEEERTNLKIDPNLQLDLSNLPATLGELGAKAGDLQNVLDSQRALIQSQVLQQQKYLQKEWQEEIQQQMHALKGLQIQNPVVVARNNGEI